VLLSVVLALCSGKGFREFAGRPHLMASVKSRGHTLEAPAYLRGYRPAGNPSGPHVAAAAGAARRIMTSKTGTGAAFCAW
jgi:hypothetical protein